MVCPRPYQTPHRYRESLNRFGHRSGEVIKPSPGEVDGAATLRRIVNYGPPPVVVVIGLVLQPFLHPRPVPLTALAPDGCKLFADDERVRWTQIEYPQRGGPAFSPATAGSADSVGPRCLQIVRRR